MTLFDLAQEDYNVIKALIKDSDELYMRTICYHMEQAIEKLLKYAIELKGSKFPYSHSIIQLYSLYTSLDYPAIVDLENMSDTLEKWEAKSRYDFDFYATKGQLAIADNIYKELYGIIKKTITFDPEQFMKTYLGDKASLMPITAVHTCTSEDECLALIDSLKHLL